MAKRVIDDSTLTAIANKIREKATDILGNDIFTPTEMPEKVDVVYAAGQLAGLEDGYWNGYQSCEKNVVNPARDKISKRIADTTGEGTLDEWVDKAIEDFDGIEAAIEAQGVDVPDFNTAPMAGLISEACKKRYLQGCELGHNQGYDDGIIDGIEQGKQAQYNEFWDTIQINGTRRNYESAFVFWRDKLFFPKYDIIVPSGISVNNMFHYFNNDIWYNQTPFNLSERLRECNITLDVSKATSFNYTFASSGVSQIPELSTISADTLNSTFYGASRLHTFEKLKLKPDGSQTFSLTFYNALALENIVIEGVIGNNISFSACPLSKDSILGKSITAEEYEALSNDVKTNNVFVCEINGETRYYYGGIVTALSYTATGKTLTLKKSAVNTAFGIDVDDETTYPAGTEFYNLRHSKDNWTFSYV